ncbi:MAG: HAMP domain-containing sensor histidine kinase, partial [Acidimicrobiia bacterium]
LFAGGVIGIALAGGLGLLVASQAVKPISALTRTVGAIAATQDFSERVDVEGDDEISELASEFNTLLNELESSQQEQVRLVRDAGHELRTPLTALRTNLEILQRHELSPEERTTTLAAAHAEIEELAALVAEVVDLATDRYEEEALGPVDLSEVVEAVAERYQKRRGRLVTVAADKSRVVGKRQAIERAVLNLVANADKFSPVGDPITIDVTRGVITVTDTGSGIDSHDLPHVFERFFRSDTARSQPGSGLGLSIVKAIVDDHGGDVFARNRASGGAEVGFSLTVDR